MPTKLTDLTELAVTPATDDFMHIVDVTDTTGGAAGTSKKITVARLGVGGGITSVNSDTGPTVVLDTDDISEGVTNEYFTDARVAANSAVVLNTAKTGITSGQASDIVTNNAKVGYTDVAVDTRIGLADLDDLNDVVITSVSTGEVLKWSGTEWVNGAGGGGGGGVTSVNSDTGPAVVLDTDDIAQGASNLYISTSQANEITVNTAKVGYTDVAVDARIALADLEDLRDVIITSKTTGDVLTFDGSDWVNRANVSSIVAGTNVTISPASGTGAVTINASGGGGGGVNNVIMPFSFYTNQINNYYIPLTNNSEGTTIVRYNNFASPFDGTLKRCTIMVGTNLSGGTGSLTLKIGSVTSTGTFTAIETASISLPLNMYTPTNFNFTTNTISAGSRYAFFLTGNGAKATFNTTGTLYFEIS